MSKKKDCLGSEACVCRTKNCPYVQECCDIVWNKKIQQRMFIERALGGSGAIKHRGRHPGVIRSKDFIRGD